MSAKIYEELKLFADAVLLGAALTFVYDGWLILRKVFRHNLFWISFEDIVYWLTVSAVVFTALYELNNGVLRWFVVVGAALGMLMYKYSFSPIFIHIMSTILEYIVVHIKKVAHFVVWPIKKLKKPIYSTFLTFQIWLEKLKIYVKNKLTVCIKLVTIALCKQEEPKDSSKGK